MKKTIVITLVLMALGAGYAWWWQQTVKEMAAMAMEGGKLTDWAGLRTKFPRFAITARLLGLDLFSPSASASQDAMRMMQELYRSAGVHSLFGLLVAAGAAGFLGGFASGRKHSRKGDPEPGVQR